MANLNTKTLANGVGDILAVDGGVTATPTVIKDGDGTSTSCKIATEKIVFQPPTADSTTFLQVLDQGGGTPIPPTYYIMAELGINNQLIAEDGKYLIQEIHP